KSDVGRSDDLEVLGLLEAGGADADPEVWLGAAAEAAGLSKLPDDLDIEGSQGLLVEGLGACVVTDDEGDVIDDGHGGPPNGRAGVGGEGGGEVRGHLGAAGRVIGRLPATVAPGALDLCEPRWLHLARRDQCQRLLAVDLGPDAPGTAGGELLEPGALVVALL